MDVMVYELVRYESTRVRLNSDVDAHSRTCSSVLGVATVVVRAIHDWTPVGVWSQLVATDWVR